MVEIPVTTIPIIRMPFHPSYVLSFAILSESLEMLYFRFELRMCRLCGVSPSFLFHPLDFLGADDDLPELAFFPTMALSSSKKLWNYWGK